MPLNQDGFGLALNLLTDATDGINKVALLYDISGGASDNATATQTIVWGTAIPLPGSGYIEMSTDLVFNCSATWIVIGVLIYHNTTLVGTGTFGGAQYNFTNAGTFTLTGLRLSLD